jgi:lipid II:glycine glycyltransferase (peptidoglycan interpeptide bridge formation enzyme)
MKSKTRYNIRLAIKKDVTVRQIDDIEPFYSLLENTADRSEFGIHTRKYYQTAFDLFSNSGACKLFLAEYQHQPLASIMVFIQGNRCWYFYGASSDDHRDRMPTYLVQWEAMRWAKQQGCLSYDFWGVPDHDRDILESQFLERGDGLWGVYRFKRGFGGDLKRSTGPWDRVFNPVLYAAYSIYFNIQD